MAVFHRNYWTNFSDFLFDIDIGKGKKGSKLGENTVAGLSIIKIVLIHNSWWLPGTTNFYSHCHFIISFIQEVITIALSDFV